MFIFQLEYGQSINWSQAKNWKLYDIHDPNAFRYSLDTLQYFKSFYLDSTKMNDFLRDAVLSPIDKSFMWMGLYVCTCQVGDGSIRKVDISVYAGFFFEEQNKFYYEVSSNSREGWLHYFHDCLAKLSLSVQ
jgi:hypothetical protein